MNNETVTAYLQDGTEVTVTLTPPKTKRVTIGQIKPGEWYTYASGTGRYMVMDDGFGRRMKFGKGRVWTEDVHGKRSSGAVTAEVYRCDKRGNLL